MCQSCGTLLSVAQIGPVYVPQNNAPSEAIPEATPRSEAGARLAFAGFWLRAFAYLVDMILVSLPFGLIGSFYPATFIKFPDAAASNPFTSLPQLTPVGFAIMGTAIWFYYTVFEASGWQATPGKRMMRIYVTDMYGQRLTLPHAAMRNLAKFISSLTFLVGYLIAGFTEKKQALHDLISSCLVLRRM